VVCGTALEDGEREPLEEKEGKVRESAEPYEAAPLPTS
jgi:hypothetical protein